MLGSPADGEFAQRGELLERDRPLPGELQQGQESRDDDEPLAGVGHERLEQAIDLIRRIVAGRTVLLIEHNMDVVMQISDEIVVMVQGQLLASGSPAEIKANPAVRAAYLGNDE